MIAAVVTPASRLATAGLVGLVIGTLGGLIGLGGAKFRLPLLLTLFAFAALEAVIVNKAISLVVVASALVFRGRVVALDSVVAHLPIVVNLLAGSLVGAWAGADVATRLPGCTLRRMIATLLIVIAAVLVLAHDPTVPRTSLVQGTALIICGLVAGVMIGGIASLLGVAGGEFLIPTLVLLFGADIRLAGSLSLIISLPTMLVGFARYSRDASFAVLGRHRSFVATMAVGSILGALLGARCSPLSRPGH